MWPNQKKKNPELSHLQAKLPPLGSVLPLFLSSYPVSETPLKVESSFVREDRKKTRRQKKKKVHSMHRVDRQVEPWEVLKRPRPPSPSRPPPPSTRTHCNSATLGVTHTGPTAGKHTCAQINALQNKRQAT